MDPNYSAWPTLLPILINLNSGIGPAYLTVLMSVPTCGMLGPSTRVVFTVFCYCVTYSTGRYLMSGNQNGTVSVWDLTSAPVPQLNSDPVLPTTYTFLAHDSDTVNGLRCVPSAVIRLVCSQQHFIEIPVCIFQSSLRVMELL